MKCRLLFDSMVRNQKLSKAERNELVQQLVAGKITRKYLSEQLSFLAKKGTVIDHPRAFRLVQLGQAEPADEECTFAADMSDAKIAAAFAAQTLLQRAQLLGAEHDASDADVAAAKTTREERRAAA